MIRAGFDEERGGNDEHQCAQLCGRRPFGSERNRRERRNGADEARATHAQTECRPEPNSADDEERNADSELDADPPESGSYGSPTAFFIPAAIATTPRRSP